MMGKLIRTFDGFAEQEDNYVQILREILVRLGDVCVRTIRNPPSCRRYAKSKPPRRRKTRRYYANRWPPPPPPPSRLSVTRH